VTQIERSRRKLLLVISSLAVGGTENHLASISRVLRARGWNIVVYCTGGEGAQANAIRSAGVNVMLAPTPLRKPVAGGFLKRVVDLVMVAIDLFAVMRRHRSGIVHFFLPEAYLVGGPLALLARIRIRIASRRSLNVYQGNHRLAGFAERCLHPHMSALLANSRKVAAELEAEGVSAGRVGLIYNGIDTDMRPTAGSDCIRRALGIGEAALVLIIVANLIPYKGHLDLIEALGAVASRMPADWKLLIVGRDDGAGAAIHARAAELGLSDRMSLLGERADIVDLLDASDVGLLASHQEGFSNAILEGMRAGLPMVVTDVGGNAEAVVDGATGFVVPPRDPGAFADAILRLASDPALRRSFGERGRQRLDEHFSLKACVDTYEALYAGLLGGKRLAEIPEIRVKAAPSSALKQ
jgi:glycosyltransferase involved in cell wall biosynthesis